MSRTLGNIELVDFDNHVYDKVLVDQYVNKKINDFLSLCVIISTIAFIVGFIFGELFITQGWFLWLK